MSREKPWGRLFAEGGVIVASILLALLADAWWGDRQDRQLEKQYYERIAVDLTADSTGLERAIYFNRIVRESALGLLSLAGMGGRSTQAPVEVVHAIAWAGFVTEGSFSGAFFRDLVSSGRLGLVSPELTADLLLYYQLGERRARMHEDGPTAFPEWARRTLPAGFTRAAQQCLWDEWFASSGEDELQCGVEVAADEAERVVSRFLGNPDLVGFLREVIWQTDNVDAAYGAHLRLNARLKDRLSSAAPVR